MTLENCAPFVVTEPQDLCTDPGNVIELSCLIEGNPIPRFQWYKNDYPISNEVTTILKLTLFLSYVHDAFRKTKTHILTD